MRPSPHQANARTRPSGLSSRQRPSSTALLRHPLDHMVRTLDSRQREAPMKRLSGNLTYANVMATVAVFLALGGGAMAATNLGKNSVGTKQLKKNSVTGAKVKRGTLTGANINLAKLGTVPSATNAASATTASTTDRQCPRGTRTHPSCRVSRAAAISRRQQQHRLLSSVQFRTGRLLQGS